MLKESLALASAGDDAKGIALALASAGDAAKRIALALASARHAAKRITLAFASVRWRVLLYVGVCVCSACCGAARAFLSSLFNLLCCGDAFACGVDEVFRYNGPHD